MQGTVRPVLVVVVLVIAQDLLQMALVPDKGAVYAEPGSPSHHVLNLLASWAATLDPAEAASAVEEL